MDKAEYDRVRYLKLKRPQIFGERKCRCCEIFLAARHGAYRTCEYCRSCVDNGAARRDQNRRYYAKHRERVLARLRAYHSAYRSYRSAYYKRWSTKRRERAARTQRALILETTI